MSAYITNQCPQCGANLPANRSSLVCLYCNTSLGVETPQTSTHSRLVKNFRKFMKSRSEIDFLIVSNGDSYIQLHHTESPCNVTCEAVSNEYLPQGSKMSGQQESLLAQMGFRIGYVPGSANYGRSVDFSQLDKIEEFAEMAETIFSQVYGRSPLSVIDFQAG